MPGQVRFEIGDQEIDGDDYFAVIEPVFWAVRRFGPALVSVAGAVDEHVLEFIRAHREKFRFSGVVNKL